MNVSFVWVCGSNLCCWFQFMAVHYLKCDAKDVRAISSKFVRPVEPHDEKYFFLPKKSTFFCKKKYFFLQKKVLIFSDKNTFHAVQCITMRAPKPPPRLSGLLSSPIKQMTPQTTRVPSPPSQWKKSTLPLLHLQKKVHWLIWIS